MKLSTIAAVLAIRVSSCTSDGPISPISIGDQDSDAWHRTRLSLLFKGKGGDPTDSLDNFRGIASEATLKKIFFKGVIRRIEVSVENRLPPQQFGFRRGTGTRDALHVVISEIERTFAREEMLYAVLVDCKKAFDRAPRHLMARALKNAGVNGSMLGVILAFFDDDKLQVDTGSGAAYVLQNRGTPQGDPLSCIAFSLLLADLPSEVLHEFRTGFIAMYADDIIIAHRNRLLTQNMLNLVGRILQQNGLDLNPAKTEVLKYRRGGPLGARDRFYWQGERLEIVPSAKYLGVRLQTSGLVFTSHIEEVVSRSLTTVYADIGDPYGLSIETAIKLFELKLLPQVSYGLERLWEYLTTANLRTLERSFTVFMKRTLRLSRSSKSRYVYLMADTVPMVETIRARVKGSRTQAFEEFISSWR